MTTMPRVFDNSVAAGDLSRSDRRHDARRIAGAMAVVVAVCLLGCSQSLDVGAAVPVAASATSESPAELSSPAERVAPAPVSASPADSDWPVFRGDALANGVAPGDLPENLEVLWKFSAQEHGFEATVAIADGRVFAGCLDGNLYALSLADGREIWKFHT